MPLERYKRASDMHLSPQAAVQYSHFHHHNHETSDFVLKKSPNYTSFREMVHVFLMGVLPSLTVVRLWLRWEQGNCCRWCRWKSWILVRWKGINTCFKASPTSLLIDLMISFPCSLGEACQAVTSTGVLSSSIAHWAFTGISYLQRQDKLTCSSSSSSDLFHSYFFVGCNATSRNWTYLLLTYQNLVCLRPQNSVMFGMIWEN